MVDAFARLLVALDLLLIAAAFWNGATGQWRAAVGAGVLLVGTLPALVGALTGHVHLAGLLVLAAASLLASALVLGGFPPRR